jgi:acetyl-CoA carboxylase carboxyltransferase component
MAAGSFKAPVFCVGWPTAEFGAMGLEGAVKLGMRRELEAIDDPAERERTYQTMVAAAYDRGSAISMASYFEIDDVIDPADTRRWVRLLFDGGDDDGWWQQAGKRRPNIDAW